MNQVYDRWYAKWYDSFETWDDDVKLFRELLSGSKKKVFEVCPGTGRILIPLAKDGHITHGIDMGNFMLSRLFEKAFGLENINIKLADILKADWGSEFDAVIMRGNILINIENAPSRDEYIAAQKLLIKKSYEALKPGGIFIMDNNRSNNPAEFF